MKKILQEYPNALRDREELSQEIKGNKGKFSHLFSNDYDEDESGETQENAIYYSKQINKDYYTLHTDENHGFKKNLIPVVVYFSKYEMNFNKITSVSRRSKILTPKVIYMDKDWKLEYVHFYLFKLIRVFFYPLNNQNLSEEDLLRDFNKIYQNYDSSEENDNADYQSEMNMPYRIRIKKTCSDPRLTNLKGDCTYCGKTDCHDCLLPLNSHQTLGDFLKKIPNSPYNEEFSIDNTYYYLADRYRNYINLNNVDFSLDLSFLEEPAKRVSNLKPYEILDFKISKENKKNNLDVLDCFKNFVKLEKLEANNEWFCPHCKKHVRATKKMEIYNAPNILIIHLKRFKNNQKIDSLIDFPIDSLDISEFVINKKEDEKVEYELLWFDGFRTLYCLCEE